MRLCSKRERFEQEVGHDDDELVRVDRRLTKIVSNTGGAPYKGTDIVEDEVKINAEAKRNIESTDDIFNGYGYGVVAYFGLMRGLILAYLVMSGLAAVMMSTYHAGGALNGDRNSFITRYTLGNMGFVETGCVSQFIGINKHVKLEC